MNKDELGANHAETCRGESEKTHLRPKDRVRERKRKKRHETSTKKICTEPNKKSDSSPWEGSPRHDIHKLNQKQIESSDESSEDEEEQRRIREAVLGIGTYIFEGNNSVQAKGQPDNGESSFETNQKEENFTEARSRKSVNVSHLKSNRQQDKDDDDHEMCTLLKTTPEFRAYVAKQLSQLLDRDLCECVGEEAWRSTVRHNKKTEDNFKLFSDSEPLSKINNVASVKLRVETVEGPMKKRIRLSSSSDSSEDETIKACVFTVADIQFENETLARLEAKSKPDGEQNVEVPDQPDIKVASTGTTSRQSSHDATEQTFLKGKRKKKKTKKKAK